MPELNATEIPYNCFFVSVLSNGDCDYCANAVQSGMGRRTTIMLKTTLSPFRLSTFGTKNLLLGKLRQLA